MNKCHDPLCEIHHPRSRLTVGEQLAVAVEALRKARLLIEDCVHGKAMMSEVVATIDAALAKVKEGK